MEQSILLFLLYADICLIIGFYMYIRKMRKLIGFHLGMNMSMVMGGMAAFLFGIMLITHMPFHFTYITLLSAIIGGTVGAWFGLLIDYQTFVTGLTNGLIVGLMAPMIGTVMEMQMLFIWFLHAFFIGSLGVLIISIKRA